MELIIVAHRIIVKDVMMFIKYLAYKKCSVNVFFPSNVFRKFHFCIAPDLGALPMFRCSELQY